MKPLPDGQRYEGDPGPWRDDDGLWFELGGERFGPFETDDDAEENFVIVQHVIARWARRIAELEAALAAAQREQETWDAIAARVDGWMERAERAEAALAAAVAERQAALPLVEELKWSCREVLAHLFGGMPAKGVYVRMEKALDALTTGEASGEPAEGPGGKVVR